MESRISVNITIVWINAPISDHSVVSNREAEVDNIVLSCYKIVAVSADHIDIHAGGL